MAIVIDIIILSYAHSDELKHMTLNTVNSLINSELKNEICFNILIIESYRDLHPFQYPNTLTIYPKQKFGYHKYMNLGLRRTSHTYVCLCNNDLIFHPGWASSILDAFKMNDCLKSASPFCSLSHPRLGIEFDSGIYYGYGVRKELVGWCIFFKRDILNTIGMLDPKYKFWYADNDYSKTIQKHSIPHALVTSSVVDHLGSRTLSTRNPKEQYRLTLIERFYFEYKWGARSYNSYMYYRKKFRTIINSLDDDEIKLIQELTS